ncbi:MAG: aldo/keto reductase [Anaerolineae bacterium]
MSALYTRQLGRSKIEVSAMGLGCWAIGGPFLFEGKADGWGSIDDNESIRAIHRALDLGVTFFDTADVYGAGHSERVLAQALKGQRGRVVIATKFGFRFDEATKIAEGADVSPAYIRQACEASLRRLNTDYIDLYQLHCGASPAEAGAITDTLEQLQAEGRIRAYAWSTDDPESARLFAGKPHCAAVQHEMNVFVDAGAMLALCDEYDLASVVRTPLAMGCLSGKYDTETTFAADDFRGSGHEWARYFKEGRLRREYVEKLDAVRETLRSNGRTLVQGALAWVWARSGRTIPIPGFKTVAQVEENCGAMRFGPLTPEQMHEIDQLMGRTAQADGGPAL